MQQKNYLGINPAGFHRLAYVEWGEQHFDKTIVCVHGLTRNSRDFDYLAKVLSQDYRLVCPDIVGRGKSDWLPHGQGYGFPQYLSDMTALIARVDVSQVDWIGTSMGGLIGMVMAAQQNSPIRRLVINDVGPMIPLAGTRRIMSYVQQRATFSNLQEAENYFRKIFAPFGKLTDTQWQHVTRHSTFKGKDGRYELAYDQNVLAGLTDGASAWHAMTKMAKTVWQSLAHMHTQAVPLSEMWHYWDQVRCPVLLLRGETSDILLPETVERMLAMHSSSLEVVEIKGVGHAPALMARNQIAIIHDWLRST
ncbi:MAG: alpha/beta hydrolase [Pseudomonadota bacterium]